MKEYDIVIGLEVHAELKTKSKVFCSCRNEFGALPNTQVCPVCLGLPGALPVINKQAVKSAILAGLAFGCEINDIAVFERKNYFYPDLSKAYQISQLEKPICLHGGITLDSGKFIRFNRIHLEEDAGKLIHVSDAVGTYIDYNRGGVPLIEMVTEPDLSSKDEVVEFLEKLRSTLIYSGVADCKMEEGGLKFDVNLSIKEKGSDVLGTRVEMKNLNSFKSVARAVEYEANRQIELLNKGEEIKQQTRGWDDNHGRNYTMREKEDANDYRYFPDPDILAINISREQVENIRKTMPESKQSRCNRYKDFGLSDYDIDIITSERYISDYFDKLTEITNEPKESANWVMTDLLRVQKESVQLDLEDIISVENLAEIIKLVLLGKITRVNSKVLFDSVVSTGKDVATLVKELGLSGDVSDDDIVAIVKSLLQEKPNLYDDYKLEPDNIINFVVGNIMRVTKGRANVEKIKPIIISMLEN
jgi:aspartyl-tRNA(Asn)/glutamyl-tRNA(Gln) amidotransferase subunit B